MPKKETVIFAVIIIYCVVRIIAALTKPDLPEWQTVTHKQYNFSIEYPTRWELGIYGENGYKGDKSEKLHLFTDNIGGSSFRIDYQAHSSPTLQDVLHWSTLQINRVNKRLIDNQEEECTPIALQEDFIGNKPIIRHFYTCPSLISSDTILFEEIYIARTNDMIILTVATEVSIYDENTETFNRIINSFAPLD